MRILFAIWSRTTGGAERAVSLFSNELVKQGHEVLLVQAQFSTHDYPVDDGVQVIGLQTQEQRNRLGRVLGRIACYRAIFRKYKPDVVIPFMGGVVNETFFASRFMRLAFISTIRINPALAPSGRVFRWWRNTLNFLSDAVFVQNEAQRNYYPKFMHNRVFSVPNFVSPEYLANEACPGETLIRCAASGRLSPQKNHSLLIRAFVRAHAVFPQLRLSIFGEGELRGRLQCQIDAAGAGEYISLPGRTDDMCSALLETDMYILSSNYEGMPNALMEAMAVGLPCISTDCPTGPADLIVSGENGILIPVGDEDALTSALLDMVQDPQKAKKMGQLARKHIHMNYSAQKIAAELAAQCARFTRGGTNR